jgi:hypothetical protein
MTTIIYQYGQLNTAGAMAPGVYTQIVQPPPVVAGVATNGYGLVGVASWGPVNSPLVTGSPAMSQANWGAQQVRARDIATAVAIAFSLGQYNNSAVRVSDGTDTAATGALKDGAGVTGATLTGFFTGTQGNQIVPTISAGTASSSSKLTVAMPGYSAEIYDNLTGAVSAAGVTPGTAYTSVPSLSISAPQASNGVQATGNATLAASDATVASGGTGNAVNDLLELSNGVILKVTAVTSGAVTTATIQDAGSIAAGSVPANPVAVTSTTGAGTGATFTLSWGLGPATITNMGAGYTSVTAAITGGGGTGGAYTLAASIWPMLVSSVNNGQSGVRGPSQLVVATQGASTAAPVAGSIAMSGGTDGAAGVSDATLIGADTTPPTGMYALQSSGVQTINLIDHQTSSQWSAMDAFTLQMGMFGAAQGQPGQSVATTGANLDTAGVDDYSLKCLVGDWVYWTDTVNSNVQRLLGPATFWGPMRANLAPNQSTLNKPVAGLVGTQRSTMSLPYSSPETLLACEDRLDFLANPSPGGNYFSFQTDRNTSSNAATNSEAYTTMTNFLALTLAANFGFVVGNPQTDDLRTEVSDSITAFLTGLWLVQQYISDVNNPTAVPFKVTLDASNNPDNQVALGLMQCLVQVKYQSIVREFLISLQGGSTVQVTVSNA